MEYYYQKTSPLDHAFAVLDVLYENDPNAESKRVAAIAEMARLVAQAALENPELEAYYWSWQAAKDISFPHRLALGEDLIHYSTKTLMVEKFAKANLLVSDEELLESQQYEISYWLDTYEYNEGNNDDNRDFE